MHSAPVAAAAAPRAPWELISTGGGAGDGTDGEAELRDPSGVFVVRRNGPFASAELAILPEHGPLKSEGNAMVSMSPAVLLETQLEGGALNACCLCCCASEWPFFNKYSLKEGGGQRGDVLVAPPAPGDVVLLAIAPGHPGWHVKRGAYLASDATVDVRWQLNTAGGFCGALLSGRNIFMLRATGTGRLLINSYGALVRYDLGPGERRVVDFGAVVAWESGMRWRVALASTHGGLARSAVKSFLTEGLTQSFTGVRARACVCARDGAGECVLVSLTSSHTDPFARAAWRRVLPEPLVDRPRAQRVPPSSAGHARGHPRQVGRLRGRHVAGVIGECGVRTGHVRRSAPLHRAWRRCRRWIVARKGLSRQLEGKRCSANAGRMHGPPARAPLYYYCSL